MKTYQNFLEAVATGKIGDFIRDAINTHRSSGAYRDAVTATQYYRKHNTTIERMRKVLFTLSGNKTPDIWSSDYRLKSLVFRRLVTQQVGYMLGNGVTLDEKEKLGRSFDNRLQTAAKMALVQGVAFGFWNFDHLEVFSFADTPGCPGFVPLLDESTGELMAGIRYWYRDNGRKPILNATLYELDGVSEWAASENDPLQMAGEKRGYLRTVTRNAFEVLSTADENYTKLPIVVLYGNDTHESELVGLRESIDCYDFVKSGFANQIDASGVYWILKNTGAMDDPDLAKFVQRMKSVRAAMVDTSDGTAAEAHTLDVPVEARKTMLEILRRDIYEDAQMLDVDQLAAAQKTATEINAAYQPQDNKCADFEYFLIEFVQKIAELAGIPNAEPAFTWNKVVNQQEETNMVLAAASYLDDEAILRHLPWLLPEEVPEILKRKADAEMKLYTVAGADGDDDAQE